MKQERDNRSQDELNRYIAQAHQLRSEAIARLTGRLFRLPARLVRRLLGRTGLAVKSGECATGDKAGARL
jgi:hypothetical protein